MIFSRDFVQPPLKQILRNVLIIGVFVVCLMADFTPPKILKHETPLLLNSGLTSTTYSDISIVVWLEESTHLATIKNGLPQKGWEWKEITFKEPSGLTAVTLSGTYRADSRQDEARAYNSYQEITEFVSPLKGTVFFHERIPESIDPAAYLSLINAKPKQWVMGKNTLSIAAHQENIAPTVVAGLDPINVQLLARDNPSSSMTILALPVLLEEF